MAVHTEETTAIRAAAIRGGFETLLGQPRDWQIRRPAMRPPRPGLNWLGPVAMLASVAVPWLAFSGATGDEGSVAFGLYIGSVSIILMAWSFVLALRIQPLEPIFGGLDSMYRAHRWAGTLAVVAMFLHTQAEPEIEGGIAGASRSLANGAEDLAGTGQTMLYVLVGISLVRWFPYRWWRLTHKLLGVPFAFACWHFYTAEKTYANNSGWGWYFGLIMVAGLTAFVLRVVVRDAVTRGTPHRVTSAAVTGSTMELELAPTKHAVEYEAGQFAVVKVQKRGLSEPHIFTIASTPDETGLRFYIRDLGDWTARLHRSELVGTRVLIEGPYGRFEPFTHGRTPTVWIAGGVGITPFLAAAGGLDKAPKEQRPWLFLCVRDTVDATGLDAMRQAEADGRINLVVCSSADGNRFGVDTLKRKFRENGLRSAHVALCGPASLLAAAEFAARALGAHQVEREDFDIRQGFGPDLSRQIDALFSSRT
ncbi:MAG: ferredoxin reductase family protein [Acidimicrobiales bacterium]